MSRGIVHVFVDFRPISRIIPDKYVYYISLKIRTASKAGKKSKTSVYYKPENTKARMQKTKHKIPDGTKHNFFYLETLYSRSVKIKTEQPGDTYPFTTLLAVVPSTIVGALVDRRGRLPV
jgi:hypothetical protein